jgi:hypothetical protein
VHVSDEADVPDEEERRAERERRRRREAVFGDVLPETTNDERDPEGAAPVEGVGDAWLRAQVPPHHGD